MAQEGAKTMAVRTSPALHAKCVLLAKLEGRSLSDLLIAAIEEYVAARWSDAEVKRHAQQALEQIDRDASVQREAIESLMQPSKSASAAPAARKRSAKR